jgi:guanylate kinase
VVTAPSGSGKTTIYQQVLKRNKDLAFSVSYTTRARRDNEIDGIDYYFVSREEFKKKVDLGELIEWAEVHDDLYGTERKQLEMFKKKGKICILDLDVQGAMNVVKIVPDAVTIFIEPPSLEELERRLKKRGTESEEKVKLRLQNAKNELEYKKYFSYIVVNDDVKKAIKRLEEVIEFERRKRR